jgi:hypothetical protein
MTDPAFGSPGEREKVTRVVSAHINVFDRLT